MTSLIEYFKQDQATIECHIRIHVQAMSKFSSKKLLSSKVGILTDLDSGLSVTKFLLLNGQISDQTQASVLTNFKIMAGPVHRHTEMG
jgi:hypothetical protein